MFIHSKRMASNKPQQVVVEKPKEEKVVIEPLKEKPAAKTRKRKSVLEELLEAENQDQADA